MKKPNPLIIIILCVVAISVLAFTINDELKNRRKESSGSASTNATNASPFIAYNPPHGKPGHRHDLPDGAPLPGVAPTQTSGAGNNLPFSDTRITQTAPTDGAVALNPAHGQPGHRCEIAVGAPLNSAPANQGITAAPTAAAVPASGKNPEHGKPGHRCDIAVGAPLDSPPAKTTVANAPSTTASTTAVAPGMNPAHGQPGHRCDIAVGAPLNAAKAGTATSASTTAPQLFPNYNFSKNDSAGITPQIILDSTTSK